MKVIKASSPPSEPAPKIAAVIIAHGQFARELLAAAETIAGPLPYITSASISWHDNVDSARAEVERAIAGVSQGRGVLLLVDMFGGAPMNIASMFLGDPGVEVISGVNLPMVITVANQTVQDSLMALARSVRDQGKEGIHLTSEILERPRESG